MHSYNHAAAHNIIQIEIPPKPTYLGRGSHLYTIGTLNLGSRYTLIGVLYIIIYPDIVVFCICVHVPYYI